MVEGLHSLSEKEKEALRLLLAGHDAKSAARELGLSVHTVRERLRDARRKLGVSSSREAARRLGQAENPTPQFVGHQQLGVAEGAADMSTNAPGRSYSLAWLAGGMLIMSLIIAAAVLSFTLQSGATASPAGQIPAPSTSASQTEGIGAARDWVALVDGRRWRDSWDAAGTLFRSQLTADQWQAAVEPVRQPLGSVVSREFQSVIRTDSLPGAPAGEYEVIEFATRFAQREKAVETIILTREGGAWKVVGYFVR